MVRMEKLPVFDSENPRFLRSSVPNYMAYMSNQATQNIRRYGTKWSDQKPVQTYFYVIQLSWML